RRARSVATRPAVDAARRVDSRARRRRALAGGRGFLPGGYPLERPRGPASLVPPEGRGARRACQSLLCRAAALLTARPRRVYTGRHELGEVSQARPAGPGRGCRLLDL